MNTAYLESVAVEGPPRPPLARRQREQRTS